MKPGVFGNSGSGKSTLSRALAARHGLAHLDRDSIVWEPGRVAAARPSEPVRADLDAFLAGHARWVVEGCYGELVAIAAAKVDEIVFLNPGIAACLAHNRRRDCAPMPRAASNEQATRRERNRTRCSTVGAVRSTLVAATNIRRPLVHAERTRPAAFVRRRLEFPAHRRT